MGDLTLLLVGVRSPDLAANERYAEALTRQLRSLPPSVSDIATYHVREVIELVESNRWLYASTDDLESVRDRLRREILKHKNPFALDLDDAEDDRALEQRLTKSAPFQGQFPGGLLKSPRSPTVWVAALAAGRHAGRTGRRGAAGRRPPSSSPSTRPRRITRRWRSSPLAPSSPRSATARRWSAT